MLKICFPKCVRIPGYSVTPEQKECLENCVDRYLEANRELRLRYMAGIVEGEPNPKGDPVALPVGAASRF